MTEAAAENTVRAHSQSTLSERKYAHSQTGRGRVLDIVLECEHIQMRVCEQTETAECRHKSSAVNCSLNDFNLHVCK